MAKTAAKWRKRRPSGSGGNHIRHASGANDHRLGPSTTKKAVAIRYGPRVRQAGRAVGSNNRISPTAAASEKAAYFDQNAKARNAPAATQSIDRLPAMARKVYQPVSAQNGSCIWSCANFTTEKL